MVQYTMMIWWVDESTLTRNAEEETKKPKEGKENVRQKM